MQPEIIIRVKSDREGNGTHSSTLAWKIPWTEEPGRLQSMVSRSRTRLSDFTFSFHFHALEKEMATHSSVLAWRVPGTGEPGGLPSLGSHRVGHDWSDLAAAAACIMSCRLQIETVLTSFPLWIPVSFLLWLLWLKLPKLCWIVVVRVGILFLFLLLGEMLSVFHHWG